MDIYNKKKSLLNVLFFILNGLFNGCLFICHHIVVFICFPKYYFLCFILYILFCIQINSNDTHNTCVVF